MWYAISIGAGLLVGLSLMVWSLTERSKRHAAERAADVAKSLAEASDRLAKQNADAAERLQADLRALRDRNAVLTAALKEAHERLLKCEDPKTIRAWLEAELKGGLG